MMVRYQGGKAKVAHSIAMAILAREGGSIGYYVEPFLGGAAVAEQLAPHCQFMMLGDIRPDVVHMFRHLVDGLWEPPTSCSKAEYITLKDATPSPLRAFYGTALSFGGRWFEGYAPDTPGRNDDYLGAGQRALLRARDRLRACPSIRWRPGEDCQEYGPPPGAVLYADPPYAGTKGYGQAWDVERFWERADAWARNGVHVYVSEYAAPDGWVPIWEHEKRVTIHRSRNATTALERLWVPQA